MITELYALIKLHPSGEEEILRSGQNKDALEKDAQERNFSSIQNTGVGRDDLHVVTYKRQSDYPYIRAWGRYCGSYQYYIDSQVELANREGAPEDAIYKASMTGRWVRFGEITSLDARNSIRFILKEMEGDK